MARRKQSLIQRQADHARVELTRGYWAVVDLADVPVLEGYPWRVHVACGKLYAVRSERGDMVQMHRMLLGLGRSQRGCTGDRLVVDHRDGDGLNNRRSNLREVPWLVNLRNKTK